MTLQKPLGLPLSEPLGLPLRKPLGLGVPYSLLPSPNSHLPSPSWLPDLYLTTQGTTRKTQISPLDPGGHVMTQPLLDHGPVLTVDNLARIAEMTDDGATVREIAAHLGIGTRSVERGRRVTGVERRNHSGHLGQPVDEVAVLRATWGEDVELNTDERREAVTLLKARGVSAAEIARTLRVARRTVERHVAKVRAA